MTVGELVMAGGPETLARHAAGEAAEKAATLERRFWLGVLERWQRNNEPDDLYINAQVRMYIRELRRKLGLKPPKELIREQTRERVRRFRERQGGKA
jgi:hypothetical protein